MVILGKTNIMKPRKLIKRFFLFTSAMQVGYYAVVYADKYKEDIKRVIKRS
ncbi:hypothetical protein SAMN04487999_0260 [Leeuwenhoekiella palythoae]|uniref:Uncharacterized protein n=1 Tax=Leeuwenhoekiella palythoae TaxID=573501 RepID=A0A1M5T6I6_9FLAO|nr:hypothetical protein DSM01_2214 [Leeuwenhoekiella palythoae]SHH46322.1 hypothetical protein SAMN04487999_0260 [Leeuwenhoekiella palythoae]